MSNKLFQSLIYQMKEELDSTVGVIDDKGVIIACSQLTRIGETDKLVFEAVSYSTSAVVYNGYTYKPFGTHGKAEYVVFVEGTGDDAKHIAGLLTGFPLQRQGAVRREIRQSKLYQKHHSR